MSDAPHSPSTLESEDSSLPAIQQLINLGYQYLTPAEIDSQRGDRIDNCFIDGILTEPLKQQQKGLMQQLLTGKVRVQV